MISTPAVADVQVATVGIVDKRGYIDVAQSGKAIGVAVSVPEPSRDCLMGRRLDSGDVAVWYPDAALVPAGESSCDAATAGLPPLSLTLVGEWSRELQAASVSP